jgi:hypothetical protein
MLGLLMHIIAKMSRDCAQHTRHVSQRQLHINAQHTQQADVVSGSSTTAGAHLLAIRQLCNHRRLHLAADAIPVQLTISSVDTCIKGLAPGEASYWSIN